jgi:glycosyltransferase involved in cell wall biosynthesis
MIWQLIDSSGLGGAESHIATISSSLVRSGHRVKVVLVEKYPGNPWLDQLAAARLETCELDGSLLSCIKAASRDRPEIIHTHGYKAGIFGRAAGMLCRVPVVSMFHSGAKATSWPLRAYETLDEWTSFLSTNLTPTHEVGRRLPFSSKVIPNYPPPRADALLGALPRRIAFIGRLSPEKRPDLFIKLCREAPHLNASWHVYGDGALREALIPQFAEAGIIYHGAVRDLQEEWPRIGLVVMPSDFEGLPMTALEAFTAGVPVLGSSVGGLRQIIEHGRNGWLFDQKNWPTALMALEAWTGLDEAEQIVMRNACASYVRTHYSEDASLTRLLGIYAQLGLKLPEGSNYAFSN